MGNKLNNRDFIKLGFPKNNSINIALGQINRFRKKENKNIILEEAQEVLNNPEKFKDHPTWVKVVEGLLQPVKEAVVKLENAKAPFSIFGENEIEQKAKEQLYDALHLPIAVKGALMPDAHMGYGLPIGGVLATDNAVIPYGVGVDIGCRMSLSVFDLPANFLKGKDHQLKAILKDHTRFGMKEVHDDLVDHEVFSDASFEKIPLLKRLKDKAYKQLGTSGSGNHFVEFGIVTLEEVDKDWRIEPGTYIAILSHSGSRGFGAQIAQHYTQQAIRHCTLPQNVKHLSWLDLNTDLGQEYWLSMNLAGDYAKACHEDIHRRIAKALGSRRVFTVENHHNFAWKEVVEGKECIVHRKGATPAGKGVYGIIPGSMTAPGFIVRGKGNMDSLQSASHGAGRLLSRTKCKAQFTKGEIKKVLFENGVTLIGGNVDEAPMAYKDIHKVMSLQSELVDVMGMFVPKIVRMDKQ